MVDHGAGAQSIWGEMTAGNVTLHLILLYFSIHTCLNVSAMTAVKTHGIQNSTVFLKSFPLLRAWVLVFVPEVFSYFSAIPDSAADWESVWPARERRRPGENCRVQQSHLAGPSSNLALVSSTRHVSHVWQCSELRAKYSKMISIGF